MKENAGQVILSGAHKETFIKHGHQIEDCFSGYSKSQINSMRRKKKKR
jgi:hypothetical protein